MFELSVALRFLREGKYQTLLIIIGISLGIAVQIFLSTLISGLQKDLIQKTVGTSAHITGTSLPDETRSLLPDSVEVVVRMAATPQKQRPIREWQPLLRQLRANGWFTTVTPVADGQAFAFSGDQIRPVLLRGLDMLSADSMYRFSRRMVAGTHIFSSSSVLIGSELARILRLSPGSTLRLQSDRGVMDKFLVAGVFDFGNKTVNESWVVMQLPRAQTFLDFAGGISGVEMQVNAIFEAQEISERLSLSFPKQQWLSWQKTNASLLAALSSQSGSSNLIQVLVIIAITLGTASVLAVSSIQKSRQIGILKAMGARKSVIGRIFLFMGALLGAAGSILGCIFGYLLVVGFLAGTAGANGKPLFQLTVEPKLLIFSSILALCTGAAAAVLPARRSAKLSPIEVIRNG